MKIEKECQFCKTIFLARKVDIKRGGGKYCSRKCSQNACTLKSKQTYENNKLEFECATCKIKFKKHKKLVGKSKSGLRFCSRKCKDSSQKIGGLVVPAHYGQTNPGTNHCINCNSLIKSKKWCSTACQQKFIWKEWCKRIEEIGIFEGFNSKHIGSLAARPKRYLLEKQQGKCAICRILDWQGKPFPTVLDHIDGDANNWSISNLRVICRNCDGQLPTYCGKNRGKSTRKLQLRMGK